MELDYGKCLYLNAEKKDAWNMINPCINGFDEIKWPCVGQEMIDNAILSRNLERPTGDNIQGNLSHSLVYKNESGPGNKIQTNMIQKNQKETVEGFTNLGESYVPSGECPDGYKTVNGKCEQVCQNCKYNERKYSKSKGFNEADGCFPNRGVYNGIDNDGFTKCTCGKKGQHCNNMFDAQGGMLYNDVYIMNVGDYFNAADMVSY